MSLEDRMGQLTREQLDLVNVARLLVTDDLKRELKETGRLSYVECPEDGQVMLYAEGGEWWCMVCGRRKPVRPRVQAGIVGGVPARR